MRYAYYNEFEPYAAEWLRRLIRAGHIAPGYVDERSILLDRPWRDADWLLCRDGKWRPVGPGTQPLVDGLSFKLGSGSAYAGKSRSGMLRAAGNAIVPQQAAEFVKAYLGVTRTVEA